MHTIDSLLQPVGVSAFFERYFEREPLALLGRPPTTYAGFPGLEDFETLLWSNEHRLRTALRVNKEGQYFELPHPSHGKDLFRWAIDQFHAGRTLVLNGIDGMDAVVARAARSFEVEVRGRVSANAFLTPAHSRGFLPHFDTHDVFVLQLHGAKVWRLYDRRIEVPVDRQIHLIDQGSLSHPSLECRLFAGDLLYVPRGFVHGPFTEDGPSLHLTMGFRPLRWSDVVHALVDVVVEQLPELRGAVRECGIAELRGQLGERLQRVVTAAASPRTVRLAIERCDETLAAQLRPMPGQHLASAMGSRSITADTRVRRRIESPCHVYDVGDAVRIQFPGAGIAGERDLHPGAIEAPLSAGGALRFIASRPDPFCAHDLPAVLSIETRVTLLRRLVREGLLILDER